MVHIQLLKCHVKDLNYKWRCCQTDVYFTALLLYDRNDRVKLETYILSLRRRYRRSAKLFTNSCRVLYLNFNFCERHLSERNTNYPTTGPLLHTIVRYIFNTQRSITFGKSFSTATLQK